MRILRRALYGLVLLLVVGLLVALYFIANPNLPVYQQPDKLHYLDQWSAEERQTYYYTPKVPRLKACAMNGSALWSCR